MATIFKESEKQKLCNQKLLSGDFFFILYGGAIRGGKTYNIVFLFITLALLYPKSRWTIVRRHMKVLRESVTEMMLGLDFLKRVAKFNGQTNSFYFKNGSMIKLFSTNTEAKGGTTTHLNIETNGIAFDEMDVQEHEFNHLMARVGSWKQAGNGTNPLTGKFGQPPNFAVGTSNPQRGWVKSRFYDKWRDGLLEHGIAYIPAKIDDNIGIEDKEVYKSRLRESMTLAEYEEKVEGNWDYVTKIDDAFFYNFDQEKHVGYAPHNHELPIVISIDENKLPYIAVSFWQFDKKNKKITQIKALPCANPYNHSRKAGVLALEYLHELQSENEKMNMSVIVVGDVSTKSGNAIDENSRSFTDIFLQELKKSEFDVFDRFLRSNPPVAKSCAFVNDLLSGWNGWEVLIDEIHCSPAIIDYLTVQSDKEGGMTKKKAKTKDGLSYEREGHFSDVFRYAICSYLKDEMISWRQRDTFVSLKDVKRNVAVRY